jgi:hypothetical protein
MEPKVTPRVVILAGTTAVATMLVRLALEAVAGTQVVRLTLTQRRVLEVLTPVIFLACIVIGLWVVRTMLSDRSWSVAVVALFSWAFIGWYVTAIERNVESLVRNPPVVQGCIVTLSPDDLSVLHLRVRTVLLLGLGCAAGFGSLLGARLAAGRSSCNPPDAVS